MKFYPTFLFLFLAVLTLFAGQILPQSPDTMWTRTFGGSNIDVGYCVQQTADSGYIISGYTRSYGTMSGRNVWLIRTDKDGNEQWNNTFGGNDDEEGYSVQQTNDGSYIIGGATSSYGAGSRDVWLIKTNPSGNLVWQKTLGGLSSDGARSVQQTTDGGYILTGWTYSYGPGAVGNVWLVKTDSLGNQEWNKYFGGSDVDRGYIVQQTIDGGYIITGYTASSGAGLDDMLLIKTNNLGIEEWSKTFGGTGRDYGNWVEQTADGGFIVTGYTLSFGAGGDDVYLVKTDPSGNEEWSETFGGTYSDVGYCVRQTIDGGYIITGHTLSFGAGVHDVWLIKVNNAVPVELVRFDGKVINKNVDLFWVTASETNNLGFEIERNYNSQLPEGWVRIGFVKGKGTSTEINMYSYTDTDVNSGKYFYRLKQIDFDGTYKYSKEIELKVDFAPGAFVLYQNYPNPFNPSTKISYSITQSCHVQIKIFDVLGNEISILVDEEKPAGIHEANFDAAALPGGVYFYQLRATPNGGQAGNYFDTKKMLLLK